MAEKVVLICGSRSIKQSWFCQTLVKSLISQNVKLIVGDAPGIDELVINTCIKHNYKNIVVVGAYNRTRRNQALKYGLTTVKYPHEFFIPQPLYGLFSRLSYCYLGWGISWHKIHFYLCSKTGKRSNCCYPETIKRKEVMKNYSWVFYGL